MYWSWLTRINFGQKDAKIQQKYYKQYYSFMDFSFSGLKTLFCKHRHLNFVSPRAMLSLTTV